MTEQTSPLHDAEFMRAFLDLVIPPEGRMPGAGDLGIWPEVAARIGANGALSASLEAGLSAVRKAAMDRHAAGLAGLSAQAGTEVIESHLPAYPTLMPVVARYLYTAYYGHPRVLEALGEPARPPFPDGFELEPISPQLLETLQAHQDH